MEKPNVYFYARDSKGNQAIVNKQVERMTQYTNRVIGEANIKVYVDMCPLSEDCIALNKLIKDLKEEDVDWVITPNSNRYYRINYEDGREKLSSILNNIHKEGANLAFSDELIQLNNEVAIENYIDMISTPKRRRG